MDKILEKLGRSIYLTTTDLTKGFHQTETTAESIEKPHFPHKNGPATFQRLMNTILEELISKDFFVYLDDIIIFSNALQEHIESLDRVFSKLKVRQ